MSRGWSKEARSRERHPDATIHLRLRMGAKLRAKIESTAAANGRSMNREIVHRLTRAMVDDEYAAALSAGASEREAHERSQQLLLSLLS